MPRPVFKTGLAGITLAGEFDSLPPPPQSRIFKDNSKRPTRKALEFVVSTHSLGPRFAKELQTQF